MTQLYMDACTTFLPEGEHFTFDTCGSTNRLIQQHSFGGFIRELGGGDAGLCTLQASTLSLQAELLLLLVTNSVRPRVNMALYTTTTTEGALF